MSEKSTSHLKWDEKKIKRLFLRYRNSRDERLRDRIFDEYVPLVDFFAYRYNKRGIAYDDLYQEGCLGLLLAIERFDLDKGVKFATYASAYIQGHMKEYFRDKGWPCSLPKAVKQYAWQAQQLKQQLGRDATEEELVTLCKVPPHYVRQTLIAVEAWRPVSLFLHEHETSEQALTPQYLAESNEFFDLLCDRMTITNAARFALEPEESMALFLYYYKDMTQCEVARAMGTYQMMVSRLIQRGTTKMRAALECEDVCA